MWVQRGVTQDLIDLFFELLRNHMLQRLRLGVHFVPTVAEYFRKVELDKPMMPDNLQGNFVAWCGEDNALIGCVIHELEVGELLKHVGNAGSRTVHLA